MIKKQFTLYLENKPGVLAGIARKLAKENSIATLVIKLKQ